MNRQAYTPSGFTLIELVTVIAIIGILITVGIPELRSYVMNNRLTAQSNTLAASLNYARGQAISLGRPVRMTAKDPADWAKGWDIWVDGYLRCAFREGLITANADPAKASCEIIGSPTIQKGVTVAGPADLAAISQPTERLDAALIGSTLEYAANGRLSISSASIDFFICDARAAEKGLHIQVLRTGRATLVDRQYQCD